MFKVVTYLIIFLLTFDVKKTKRIVDIIYNKEVNSPTKTVVTNTVQAPSKVKARIVPKKQVKTEPIVEVKKPVTKQDELEQSLKELKAKKNKTVQDKNNIGVIEAVLKNFNKNLN